MTTDLRTEEDLRAALETLSSGTTTPAAVLARVKAAAGPPHGRARRRRLGAALLPAAAVLAVLGVAVGITLISSSSSRPATSAKPNGSNSLVGVWWQLHQVNGRHQGTGGASLDIAVRGNFRQSVGTCEWITGRITIGSSALQLTDVRHESANCIAVRGDTRPAVAADLHRLLHGEVRWSVSANTLTLSAAGLTMSYRPYPGSATPSRQWTYHGVGISVPASWPSDRQHCAAPTTSAVIYPRKGRTCAAAHENTTTVQFSSLAGRPAKSVPAGRRSPIEIDGTPATEGFRQFPDGRQVAEIRVPSHDVAVTITSPDASLAAHLAEFEIYIVD